MEKYTKAQMEVIEFEAEDVITTSNPSIPSGKCPFDTASGCPFDQENCTANCLEAD